MTDMSPELKRALESIADLQGRPVEDIYAKIRLRKKKEIIVEWEPIRYLPVRTDITNFSWFLYYTRESIRIEMIRAAEKAHEEWDLEILFGINWKLKRPETDFSILITT